jgi:hypothetical protein
MAYASNWILLIHGIPNDVLSFGKQVFLQMQDEISGVIAISKSGLARIARPGWIF